MAHFYEAPISFTVVPALDTTAPQSGSTGSEVNILLGCDSNGNIYLNGVATDNGANVASVYGRVGVVTASSGDYSVAQVTGAAPLASPTFTGVPAAPTAAPLTSTTQIATTNFVTLAVGVETTRAEAAEALAFPASKIKTFRSPSFTSLASATNSGAVTANWSSAFADNNYTVIATVEIGEVSSYGAVTSIISVASVQKQAAGAGVVFSIANADSIPHTWSVNLVGIHD
jgi:hypothetical protein